MTDPDRRLRAIAAIALDILAADGDANKDERIATELRDIRRLATGEMPRTDVGRAAWAEAEDEEE